MMGREKCAGGGKTEEKRSETEEKEDHEKLKERQKEW